MKIKNNNITKDNLFFTSDPHYFHHNIIKYCNRPFIDLEQMHENLITLWNKTVPKDGFVILAGDFAMTGNIGYIKVIREQLNGTIYKIYGNHDYQNNHDRKAIIDIFNGNVMDVAEITIEDEELEGGHINFFISHYPHLYWRRDYVHLHGHVHSGLKSNFNEMVPKHPMRYDIGVDNNNFTPVSYEELKVILTKKQMNLL
jgi:calcineurin-like phosphoesterase family protein